MNRTFRHLSYAVGWLLAFTTAIAIFAALASGEMNPGLAMSVSQLGSIVWVLGFAAIFYSWARKDAIEYGRSSQMALIFAVLWPFLLVISHAAYLLFTRGWRSGFLAILKFICFLLAAGIIWFAFSKLLGALL
ncbi:MAG: hypothetical protein H6933_02625 [Burkholderiaceae bacterium]|nr:hypothetical protein [Burkholderiaceae bacterium]